MPACPNLPLLLPMPGLLSPSPSPTSPPQIAAAYEPGQPWKALSPIRSSRQLGCPSILPAFLFGHRAPPPTAAGLPSPQRPTSHRDACCAGPRRLDFVGKHAKARGGRSRWRGDAVVRGLSCQMLFCLWLEQRQCLRREWKTENEGACYSDRICRPAARRLNLTPLSPRAL